MSEVLNYIHELLKLKSFGKHFVLLLTTMVGTVRAARLRVLAMLKLHGQMERIKSGVLLTWYHAYITRN